MAQQVREPLVTIKHDKIKAEAKVALSAVPHYEKQGWKPEKGELTAATKAVAGGETATAASKKTNGN